MQITLPARFYQWTPASNPRGSVEEPYTLEVAKTAFISMHCWNIGTPDGTPVPEEFGVGMGMPANHDLAGIAMREELFPCLEAARSLAMPVVHVQSTLIGQKYPHLMPPMPESAVPGPAIPEQSPPQRFGPISDHAGRRATRVHGAGYMEWRGWDCLDFPAPVQPKDDETVVVDTDQFDLWLRQREIDTLLYTGFATNLCILDAPGGMRHLSARGYRCILLREATTAVEYPDTLASQTNKELTLRYVESWVGYTASTRDFLRVCELGRSRVAAR